MSKGNKSKNSFFTGIKRIFVFIYNFLMFIIKEIFYLFRCFGVGLFKCFDFLLTSIFSLFTYIFYGLMYFFKFLWTIISGIYKYFFKPIFLEIYYFINCSLRGAYFCIALIIYYIPRYIITSLSNVIIYLRKKFKRTFERFKTFIKETPKRIKEYFIKKWNNLSIVKHYKNKRERELEILLIDKFGKDAERSQVKQTYQYLARNKDGKLIKGYFSALSKLDTHSYLLDEGYEVYEIKTSKWINFVHGESRYLQKSMKHKDLIFWLTQLSTYLKSGIQLNDSIKILAKQDKRNRYKKVYDSIIYELTMGESFSSALSKQGNVFPGLLVNMIKAAELIGNLESTLDEMSDYYTQKEDTRKSLVSAMTYPSLILVFASAVIIFILTYIIPKFKDIYASTNTTIGGFTLFIMNTSEWLQENYLYLLLGIIGVVILYRLLFKNVKAFRTTMQFIFMHLPIIGNLLIYNEMTLFAKTFSALQKNNVMLTESIDILSKITKNEIYKMIMYDTISNLLRGDKMSMSFKDHWAVPELAYFMITTGESTGEIACMLDKVSKYYQGEVKNKSNTLKTFIEPIMIIILAVIVGAIILAVIIPMFQMYGNVL